MELKSVRWNEDLSVISMDGDLEKFNFEKNQLMITHACQFKEDLVSKLPNLDEESLEHWRSLRKSLLNLLQPRRESRYFRLNHPNFISVVQDPIEGLDSFIVGIDKRVPSEYLTVMERIPYMDEIPSFSPSSYEEYEDIYYTIINNLIPLQ